MAVGVVSVSGFTRRLSIAQSLEVEPLDDMRGDLPLWTAGLCAVVTDTLSILVSHCSGQDVGERPAHVRESMRHTVAASIRPT